MKDKEMINIWLDYNVKTELHELKRGKKVLMTFKIDDYFKAVKVAQRFK